MIEILSPEYYDKLLPLLIDTYCYPELHSIISLNNPGKVYIDNSIELRTALIWCQGLEGFYLIGDSNNKIFLDNIKQYINNVLIKEFSTMDINYLEISTTSEALDRDVESLFVDKDLKYDYQLCSSHDKLHLVNNTPELEYDIRIVDKDIHNTNLVNKNFIIDEINLFWGSLDNFLAKRALMLYMVVDNTAVSICYSGFIVNSTHTIGIETLKEYRRKGYAKTLCLKFLRFCELNDYTAYWDCTLSNIGSKTLAKQLGFSLSHKYKCYYFNF